MVDDSRMFAWVENTSFTVQEIQEIISGSDSFSFMPDGIESKWLDFVYKEEKFTVFSGRSDLIFFADNQHCPESLLNELLQQFEYSACA